MACNLPPQSLRDQPSRDFFAYTHRICPMPAPRRRRPLPRRMHRTSILRRPGSMRSSRKGIPGSPYYTRHSSITNGRKAPRGRAPSGKLADEVLLWSSNQTATPKTLSIEKIILPLERQGQRRLHFVSLEIAFMCRGAIWMALWMPAVAFPLAILEASGRLARMDQSPPSRRDNGLCVPA